MHGANIFSAIFSAFKTMMSQPTCHMELMERAKRMHSCNLAQPQNCFGANIKNHKPLQVRNRSTSTQIVSASEGPKGNQQWFQKRLSQDPFRAKDARRPRKATGHNGSNQVCCLLRGGFESAIGNHGNPWHYFEENTLVNRLDLQLCQTPWSFAPITSRLSRQRDTAKEMVSVKRTP